MNKAQLDWAMMRHESHLASVSSVKSKIASGEYPLEHVECCCGGNNDEVIQTEDREGIPHRIVVCNDCAIARATPRMTEDAYSRYYNDEYRKLIYRWIKPPFPENQEEYVAAIRRVERAKGESLLQKVSDEDIPLPKRVLDIGCYQGGMLDAFHERGCETWGLDFNQDAANTRDAQGHIRCASLDALVEAGEKFDFIIMQDVIEHFTDLKEMLKVRELLTDDGYLYVYTPGLFRSDPKGYWQLAHTYYFVASTLMWIMALLGFGSTYIDEDIVSFWQKCPLPETVLAPPSEWAAYIRDEAAGLEERKLPPFRGVCKFTKKLLYDNMLRNFAKQVPDISAISNSESGAAIIVSGGPSINGRAQEVKDLQAAGGKVFSIVRMYPWCVENGIIPDYVVALDCSEEQEKGFTHIRPETTHLMATVTRPEIMQTVLETGAPVYIFDARDDRRIKVLRRDAGYTVATVINSGGTVALTCMSCAFNLGFTELHVFGFDCMFPSPEQFHAQGISGTSVDQHVMTATIDGEEVLTTPSMIEFARQALDLFSVAHDEKMLTKVTFHGDSLITRMWDGEWHDDDSSTVG